MAEVQELTVTIRGLAKCSPSSASNASTCGPWARWPLDRVFAISCCASEATKTLNSGIMGSGLAEDPWRASHRALER